jgi:hypothetical protein
LKLQITENYFIRQDFRKKGLTRVVEYFVNSKFVYSFTELIRRLSITQQLSKEEASSVTMNSFFIRRIPPITSPVNSYSRRRIANATINHNREFKSRSQFQRSESLSLRSVTIGCCYKQQHDRDSDTLPYDLNKNFARRTSTLVRNYHHNGPSSYHDSIADDDSPSSSATPKPGSKAFILESDRHALVDLFRKHTSSDGALDRQALGLVLKAVGETPDEETLEKIFRDADLDGNGTIDIEEFLTQSDKILGSVPAGMVLVVGGPGSGKGVLSKRLVKECGVVHISSGDLLREEVDRDSLLGREVKEIMIRGDLVSSAVIVTLMRRKMRLPENAGKRVLLDGFPRSLQNATDLVELCGQPELALHLKCDGKKNRQN